MHLSYKLCSNDHIPAFGVIQCNRFRADSYRFAPAGWSIAAEVTQSPMVLYCIGYRGYVTEPVLLP